MSELEIINLKKEYKTFDLNVSFSLEKNELLCVLGPSGCGKSTLLSLISGLEEIDSGEIFLEKENITNLAPYKRNIGFLFQGFSLFTNMNTEKNVMYGMKNKTHKEKKELASSLLCLVGLEGYEKRKVESLSGGEAQRVSLARALGSSPKILLLDEPLSQLDLPLRKRIRKEIKKIQEETKISMLYVTHDREEAFDISSRIIVMNEGRIKDLGKSEELYNRPKNLFTAFFLGPGSALKTNENNKYLFFRPEWATVDNEKTRFASTILLQNSFLIESTFTGENYLNSFSYKEETIYVNSETALKNEVYDIFIDKTKAVYIFED